MDVNVLSGIKPNYKQNKNKLQHGDKNQYDGKIDLLKLIFWFYIPENIYRVK